MTFTESILAKIDFSKPRFAEMYESTLVQPLFRPWVETLFEKTSLAAGQSVLDVACGTGIVSRVAREKLGAASHIVGIDLSEPMLSLARTISPTVDFRLGNAMALPLGTDEEFDVVICQQGIQFFPDRRMAVSEMMSALKPGGRVALAAWTPASTVPFYRELQQAAEQHVGAVSDHRYLFGSAEELGQLLSDAGFRDVRAEIMSRRVHFIEPDLYVRTNASALVDMSATSPSMNEDTRANTIAAIVNDSREIVQRYRDGDGISFEATNLVGWAQR